MTLIFWIIFLFFPENRLWQDFSHFMQGDNLHEICKETICMKCARRQFAWNVRDNLHEMCKETICKKCETYLLKSIHKKISKCCLLQFLPIMLSVITKTYPYNSDPLKPHFYIVKLGFTGVYIIFLIFAQKHRLWVLVRTTSLRQF